MPDDPKVLANRLLQRAWNRDGLPEIGIGLMFTLVAALLYAQEVLPRRSPGQVAAILVFAFGLPILGFGLQPLVKRVRERWLIERSGFVEHLPPPKRRYIGALAVVAVVLPVLVFAVNRSERVLLPGLPLIMTGGLGALICVATGWRARVVRLTAGGVLMLATATGLAMSDLPVEIAMAILFGVQGQYHLLTGGVVLLRFIHDER